MYVEPLHTSHLTSIQRVKPQLWTINLLLRLVAGEAVPGGDRLVMPRGRVAGGWYRNRNYSLPARHVGHLTALQQTFYIPLVIIHRLHPLSRLARPGGLDANLAKRNELLYLRSYLCFWQADCYISPPRPQIWPW